MVTSVREPSSSSSSSYSSPSRSSSSGAIGAQRSIRHHQRVRGGGDVVHPKDGGATLEREDVGGDGRRDALVGIGAAGQPAEERLARGADDDREAEARDRVQVREQ